jgi:hypothetical protein
VLLSTLRVNRHLPHVAPPSWRRLLLLPLLLLLLANHHCFCCCCSLLRGPLGGNKPGWELTASRTASLLDVAGDSRVHFGDVIGSGSYGMVFK